MNWLIESNVCPGLFYGTPAQDGFLIRIRTPGGWLNQQQGRAIAALVEQWGGDIIQVTNRANLQIRSVHTAPTPAIFQELQRLGLAARDPRVDHLRNLMASPTAGIDPQELIDTRPLVQALDTYIQRHPELADLPAKFSIGIDGGGAVGIGTRSAIAWEHRYNEIQLSAVLVEVGRETVSPPPSPSPGQNVYFRLALGADKQLWDTQVLIAPNDCVSVVAALVAVYLDYVKQAPQASKKPRMKHLMRDWGIDRYLGQVNQLLPSPLRPVTHGPGFLPTRRYGHLGIHPQRQGANKIGAAASVSESMESGCAYIGVSLPLGQLTATQLLGLVHLAEQFGSGQLRLTPWQTVLLPDIPHERVADVVRHLTVLGLSVPDSRMEAAIVACAGKPGCAAALTQTQPHAIALATYLHQQITLESPVNIHLTGCAKSCAQPSPAEITLLGTAIEQQGQTVEGYQVYVGDGQQSLKYPLWNGTFADVPSVITQLLHRYQQERESAHESLGEFVNRVGAWGAKTGGA